MSWDSIFEWNHIFPILAKLCAAYGLAIPIGINREKETRNAGLRTFPLVSIAACGFMLVGVTSFQSEESLARVLYGLITGIGFIGGGAILQSDNKVTGTATATGIWCTGAIGAAVALSRYEIAILISLFTFFTLLIKSKE